MRLFKHLMNQSDEYPGNIWGWKFSFVGLGLIVVLGGLMIYQHITLGVPLEGHEIPVSFQDSLVNALPK